jgi:hypothetical protein
VRDRDLAAPHSAVGGEPHHESFALVGAAHATWNTVSGQGFGSGTAGFTQGSFAARLVLL